VPKFIDAITRIEGAYSLVGLSEKKMIGARDPLGIRPLCIGDLDGAYILASETCALDIIGARFVRDVSPARLWSSPTRASRAIFPSRSSRPACASSNMSISPRPDSTIENRNVYDARKKIGEELAKECPVDADVIIPVPDSGTPAAIGFAQQANLPFELGIIRNHYVGRTFIAPSSTIRHMGVKLKLNPNKNMIEGKRVVLVDDSIVRGTTSQKIVQLVREAGAREVHMRIASPPTPCRRAFTVSTRRKNPSFSPRACRSRRWRISSASTVSVSCPSTASTAPCASPGATPNARNSATPALPAITRRRSPIRKIRAMSAAFRCWPTTDKLFSMTSLEGRIALVTGASRGIGYWTALALAKQGAHVIAVARTTGGLEELDDEIQAAGGSATLVPMDLTDMPAVDRLGGAINERWGKLDILVANAGVLGTISPVGHIEAKVFDKVMAINVTATWRVIRSVEPLLIKSDAGA
jgi:adenine/guanine phosphoribosyltransferase-like PRPP-binding protein